MLAEGVNPDELRAIPRLIYEPQVDDYVSGLPHSVWFTKDGFTLNVNPQ